MLMEKQEKNHPIGFSTVANNIWSDFHETDLQQRHIRAMNWMIRRPVVFSNAKNLTPAHGNSSHGQR